MNAQPETDQPSALDLELRLVRFYHSLKPEAQPRLTPLIEAIIARKGVRDAALALFEANNDPAGEQKAEQMVEQMGAAS